MHAGLCSRTVSARAQPCVALRCLCSASTRDVDAGSAKLRLAEGILRHALLNLQPATPSGASRFCLQQEREAR